MNKSTKVIDDILKELERAEEKHPGWPADFFEGHAIISEEVGELAQAIIDHKYKGQGLYSLNRIREEAIQVAAMGIRFLLNLKRMYENDK